MPVPALSCYTTCLVAYLAAFHLDAPSRFAAAVHLAVRTDLPDGLIAFSHHRRVDRLAGHQLGYDSALSWEAARDAIGREARARGAVIVVASTAAVPWSPHTAAHTAPHWLLVRHEPSGRWLIDDPFAAILPHGEQHPFSGALTDPELCGILRPALPDSRQSHLRDCYALGERVTAPPPDRFRWLHLEAAAALQPPVPEGRWLRTAPSSLRWLAERLSSDPAALGECLDDLWAASRHQAFALGAYRSSQATALAEAWTSLPRALRFAAASARRGRPRPGLVRSTLNHMADLAESHLTSLAAHSANSACHTGLPDPHVAGTASCPAPLATR